MRLVRQEKGIKNPGLLLVWRGTGKNSFCYAVSQNKPEKAD